MLVVWVAASLCPLYWVSSLKNTRLGLCVNNWPGPASIKQDTDEKHLFKLASDSLALLQAWFTCGFRHHQNKNIDKTGEKHIGKINLPSDLYPFPLRTIHPTYPGLCTIRATFKIQAYLQFGFWQFCTNIQPNECLAILQKVFLVYALKTSTVLGMSKKRGGNRNFAGNWHPKIWGLDFHWIFVTVPWLLMKLVGFWTALPSLKFLLSFFLMCCSLDPEISWTNPLPFHRMQHEPCWEGRECKIGL